MTELIKITEQDGKRLIDARELYQKLESKRQFANWIESKVTNNPFFEENLDWLSMGAMDYKGNLLKIKGNKFVNADNKELTPSEVRKNYGLTLDTAKKVAMSEQTEVGNKVRDYFLQMEKKALQVGVPRSFAEALRLAAQQQEEIETKKQQLQIAESTIETNKPKVVFAEAVAGSDNLILIRQFAKVLSDNGFKIGQNRLFVWFRDNNYLSYKNEPYQNVIEQGLFEVIERTVGAADQTFTTRTTKITGKGQIYFSKKIRDNF